MTLTIGPAFLSAAVYLCLGRIIVVYGEHFSRLKPRTYSVLFISCDVLALVLQAIGGGIASSTDIGSSTQQTGINIMIAGLATQVASMFLFLLLSLEFAWRAFKNRGNWAPALASLRQTVLFKAFLWGTSFSPFPFRRGKSFRPPEHAYTDRTRSFQALLSLL